MRQRAATATNAFFIAILLSQCRMHQSGKVNQRFVGVGSTAREWGRVQSGGPQARKASDTDGCAGNIAQK
jgi:hypothetical protein